MVQAVRTVTEDSPAARARAGLVQGVELVESLRREPDLTGIDLRGCRFDGADLRGLSFFKANLAGASFRGAKLDGVELSGADLSAADLEAASLVGAGLGLADLSGVRAFNANLTDATLTGSKLTGGHFDCAVFVDARMRECDLTSAGFRAADLRQAELNLSRVHEACFDDADLRGSHWQGVSDFEDASWYGVDTRDINFSGAYRLRRHIIDENYLKEFREAGRVQEIAYEIWRLTSDCGRSLARWTIVILSVALAFAGVYAVVGLDTGIHEPGPMTYVYYSVVTLTSLGYGDILPTSSLGQALAILEVGIGYMMLGGLISIFANKMARRGE